MALSTLQLLAYSLKRYYSSHMIEDEATKNTEFWKRVKKTPGMGGEGGQIRWPLLTGNAPGVGGSFSAAQSNAGATTGSQFAADPKDYFGVIQLDRKLFRATEVPSMAWMEARQQEASSVLRQVGQNVAIGLYRYGTGSIGRRATLVGNVVTLTVPSEAINFFMGQVVQASSTDSAGGLRTGSTTVTGINYNAGTITLANAASITAFADNDYLANSGDFAAPPPMGLQGWIPPVAETTGTFFGVARAPLPELLQGHRFTAAAGGSTSVPISECVRKISMDISTFRGKASHVFINPKQWTVLANEGGSRVYREQGGTAEFGFDKLVIKTATGPVEVVSDPYCPLAYGWVVDMSTWEYRFMGKGGEAPIQLITDDGLQFRAMPSADAFEFRWATYGNLICYAPAWNGVFEMSTTGL